MKFYYETRCRRCGKITEWFYGESDDRSIKAMDFAANFRTFVQEIADSYRVMPCTKCDKTTIQDLVSYKDEKL